MTEEAIEIVEEVAKETASKVSDNFSEEFANKLVRQGSKEVPPVTQETAAGNTEAVVDDIVSEVASEVANQPPASEAVQDSVTTLERPTGKGASRPWLNLVESLQNQVERPEIWKLAFYYGEI